MFQTWLIIRLIEKGLIMRLCIGKALVITIDETWPGAYKNHQAAKVEAIFFMR